MSITVQKGNDFSGSYTAIEIAGASDWSGTVSVYKTYPGTPVFTNNLTLFNDKLIFTFATNDILDLDTGVYAVVGNLKSVTLGVDTYRLDYMTVTEAVTSYQPMTTITMTIAKIDGTPTGTPTKTFTNTADGAVLVNGWKGLKVTATHSQAYNIGTEIIGTEPISTETNAAGYAQLTVIKGSTVTVSCASLGKTVTVDTTGLDTIDLSEFF